MPTVETTFSASWRDTPKLSTKAVTAARLYLVCRTAHDYASYGGEASRVPVRAFRNRPDAEAFIEAAVARLHRSCNPFRYATPETWGE